jgi:hypothetical protein
LKAKGSYRTASLERLATTLLDVVFAAQGHAFVQARARGCARVCARTHARAAVLVP